MPGVGLMVTMAGLGSKDPEFKSPLAVEIIRGGVDSACHPSEVVSMCRTGFYIADAVFSEWHYASSATTDVMTSANVR